MKTYSDSFVQTHLSPAFIDLQGSDIRLSELQRKALAEAADYFSRSPDLCRLVWHCHRLAFLSPEPDPDLISSWNPAAADSAAQLSLFHAIVLLTGVPSVFARQQKRGIPRDITADTLSDVGVWMESYLTTHKRPGLAQFGWLSGHFCDKLFKLGRLQFNLSKFWYPYRAFLNEQTATIATVSAAGVQYRGDGQIDGANGIHDAQAWTAECRETDAEIVANPIHPTGRALRTSMKLDKRQWREILKEHDDVLSTHIPAVGAMEAEACGESMSRATPFFQRYFPDASIHAITCKSWLMDGQLEQYLKPTANIVAFLQEWYLLPAPKADDYQTFERVFGGPVKIEQAPQETSLQRAVIAHVKAGGHWRSGLGVIFPLALRWGCQHYRSSFDRIKT